MSLTTLLRWLLSRLRNVLLTSSLRRLLLRLWLALKSRAVRANSMVWRSMHCTRTNCSESDENTDATGGTCPPNVSGPVIASRQPTRRGTGLFDSNPLQERHAFLGTHVPDEGNLHVGWRSVAELHPADTSRQPYLSHETDTRHASTPNFGQQTHERNMRMPLQGVPVENIDNLGLPPSPSRPESSASSSVGIVVHSPTGRHHLRVNDDARMSVASRSSSIIDSPLPPGSLRSMDTHDALHQEPRPMSQRTSMVSSMHGTSIHGTSRADMNQFRAVPAGVLPKDEPLDMLRKKGIIPVDTTHILRYDRGHTIERYSEGEIILQPMTVNFEDDDVPSNWTRFVHPEGALYYFDEHRRILTEADVCKASIRETLENVIAALEEAKASFHEEIIPADAELVLELAPRHAKEHCMYYYFVDHRTRSLFWLNPMYTESLLYEVPAAKRMSHIRLRLEEQYWTHWEYFPINRGISEELLQEFVGMMMHLGIDSITSRTANSPYRIEDLTLLMDLVKNANFIQSVGGYSATCIGRIMGVIVHDRFLNFWGQPLIARLDRSQPVYKDSRRVNSLLLPLLSPVLFFAPTLHYRSLQHLWLDKIVQEKVWRRFILRLQEEWDKYLLPATVLLSANVAFLAIPSVDQTNQAPNFFDLGNSTGLNTFKQFDFSAASPQRTGAQIASYISLVCSTGTIILGMILDRQHRENGHMMASEARQFLAALEHPRFGLEPLAILYSLPYALLMWGMIAFAAACILLFFDGTTAQTQVPMALISTIAVASVVWCLYTAWSHEHSWMEQLKQGIRRLKGIETEDDEVDDASRATKSVKSTMSLRDTEGGEGAEHDERGNEVHPMKTFRTSATAVLGRIRAGIRKQTTDSDVTRVGTLP